MTEHENDGPNLAGAGELNYADYLELDTLLQLQSPRAAPPAHDELLFIVVHQASELWLKELLHELDKIKADLSGNHLFRVISSFRRATNIVEVLIHQLKVLETMTPVSFNQFREFLDSSSGFQSMQFRELEFVLGYKRPEVFDFYDAELGGRAAAEARLADTTVPDCFRSFLSQRGVTVPPPDPDPRAAHTPDPTVQDGILALYLRGGEYRILFELMLDFDTALQDWRYQHVTLVERTIGNKTGTGGSSGVAFLRQSLFTQVFPDIWAIRHRF